MFDHFIYDFDGTLSDTYPVAARVFCEMLTERGIAHEYDAVYTDLKVSFRHASKKYGLENAEFVKCAKAEALISQRPFPEVAELLHSATLAGKKNYIYTHSGPEVWDMLRKWGVAEDVTFLLDKSFSFPLKPDPTALLYLLERFGIDSKTALMVGDRSIDIDAGKNAGVAGCLFDEGNYYPNCKADYRVTNLLEIKKLF